MRGRSMAPTVEDGDRLVRRVRGTAVRPGQIVVVEHPNGGDGSYRAAPAADPADRRVWMVKRCTAVAGDPVPAGLPARCATGDGRVPPRTFTVLSETPVTAMIPAGSASSRVTASSAWTRGRDGEADRPSCRRQQAQHQRADRAYGAEPAPSVHGHAGVPTFAAHPVWRPAQAPEMRGVPQRCTGARAPVVVKTATR
ncbi:S26 family signal peptidase [Actinoplanes sp. ATCC 53533]|uniref:S26 family signal peptidase n=1 Tax=Actinoplanes sp. ATCC 53533 TaxID=1288362 RepID=UPI003515A978